MTSGKIRKCLTPLPPCRTSSVETYPPPPLGRRNCRYPPPPPRLAAFHLNHPPPSPFLPTLTSKPAIIYKNTEILYAIKSSTYVQIIKLMCRGFKFSQIGCANNLIGSSANIHFCPSRCHVCMQRKRTITAIT